MMGEIERGRQANGQEKIKHTLTHTNTHLLMHYTVAHIEHG